MAGGFWNKNLRVDLTNHSSEVRDVSDEVLRTYIGGVGVATRWLMDEVPASCDALDPGNLLVFATGPFQASKISGSAKFSVVTRSPLTDLLIDSAAGASWGIRFKKCGFDFLSVTGRSETPVYLLLSDDQCEILPADEIWGLDSRDATAWLREKYRGSSVAVIGTAGERCTAMANINVDDFSVAGRGGTGAVAGSKNLKAVVVNGSLKPPVDQPEKLSEMEKSYRKTIAKVSEGFREFGTIGGLTPGEKSGNLPIRNWAGAEWKGAEKIGYPGYANLNPKPHPCMYCAVACHRTIKIEFPDGFTFHGPGPEYESLALLGASCLIDDLETLVKANDLCNRIGVDTMSAGSCAAFAMEALEKGHTRGKKPDYDFGWGNGPGLLAFLRELGDGEGFGGLFSRGIRAGAAEFDPEAAEYAHHVKGMDIPAHDPRVYYNLSLSYATGNRGACHMRAYSQISTMGALLPEAGISVAPDPDTLEDAAHVVKTYQDFTSFYNACVMCQFMIWGGYGLADMVDSLNVITGWDMSIDDVLAAGDRIFTLQRMLNLSWGVKAGDDRLPKRFFVPSETGGRAGKYPKDFALELARLYEERGWDANGVPTRDKLAALGIET